jgi:hypothetical protein
MEIRHQSQSAQEEITRVHPTAKARVSRVQLGAGCIYMAILGTAPTQGELQEMSEI